MVCNSIFGLFLSRILVTVFSSFSRKLYLHCSSDVKFYIATFQKKSMIGKTSFFSHKYPCLPLKENKREKRSNNVGKTIVIFPNIFCEKLGALVRLVAITKP